MVNSWHMVLIFVVFSVTVFDFNYAAVRERRGLIFGRNDQTTSKTILKSPLGFVAVSITGGQKAPEDPCNPSQNSQQSSGRKPLVNIKIPSLPSIFSKGNNQASNQPAECTTLSPSPTETPQPKPTPEIPQPKPTEIPQPKPTSSVPIKTPEPQPLPSSPLPPKPTPAPTPTTSGHVIESTSTVDPDDELINSIFGGEPEPTAAPNTNGAGKLDFRYVA